MAFTSETFKFLKQLKNNNNRDWFNKNKDRYEALVREPSLEFIESAAAPLKKISEHFVAIPKKMGGSLMRVYRDTRFSKDKTPYKTNNDELIAEAKAKFMVTNSSLIGSFCPGKDNEISLEALINSFN